MFSIVQEILSHSILIQYLLGGMSPSETSGLKSFSLFCAGYVPSAKLFMILALGVGLPANLLSPQGLHLSHVQIHLSI